ncbi:type I phosphodiesterase / nucleotide pyrophosphatase domain-containing protein [Ditylenchus destructor]|nr:type I phosphodiesterase / nucleotide pyrophosphatase domain-containing protein [Ditylenchus destructor]
MAKCGVQADYMLPSYPTQKYPNMHTLSTGRFPGSHGVYRDYIYDEVATGGSFISAEKFERTDWQRYFSAIFGAGNAPKTIWEVAKDKRVFCLDWLGCNSIGYPKVHLTSDDKNKLGSLNAKATQIKDWLNLADNERPHLILVGANEPGDVAQYFTEDRRTREIKDALHKLNTDLNDLFENLNQAALLNCANFIIVGTRGISTINNTIHLSEMTKNHDYRRYRNLKFKLLEDRMHSSNGPLASIHIGRAKIDEANEFSKFIKKEYFLANPALDPLKDPKPGDVNPFIKKVVLSHLECYDQSIFRVYDRVNLPKRYHYSTNGNVGDVLVEGRPGNSLVADDTAFQKSIPVMADSGFDYIDGNMHTIFFGRGPNFKPGSKLPPFQNVELFNLFLDLLEIEHTADNSNDGTIGLTNSILHGVFPKHPTVNDPIKECPEFHSQGTPSHPKIQLSGSPECSGFDFSKKNDELSKCTPPKGNIFYSSLKDLVVTKYCDTWLLRHKNLEWGYTTIVYEQLKASDFPKQPTKPSNNIHKSENCFVFDSPCDLPSTNCKDKWNEEKSKIKPSDEKQWHSLMANTEDALAALTHLQFLMPRIFIEEQFKHLQAATRFYTRKYKRIVSITGTIFDFDMDGIADSQKVLSSGKIKETLDKYKGRRPTHIFRILMRCEDGNWDDNWNTCKNQDQLRVISFIMPLTKDLNCLKPHEYLLANSARVRDVELLTNVVFFQDKSLFSDEHKAMLTRMQTPIVLWDALSLFPDLSRRAEQRYSRKYEKQILVARSPTNFLSDDDRYSVLVELAASLLELRLSYAHDDQQELPDGLPISAPNIRTMQ